MSKWFACDNWYMSANPFRNKLNPFVHETGSCNTCGAWGWCGGKLLKEEYEKKIKELENMIFNTSQRF